jgi:hypothetical protein
MKTYYTSTTNAICAGLNQYGAFDLSAANVRMSIYVRYALILACKKLTSDHN